MRPAAKRITAGAHTRFNPYVFTQLHRSRHQANHKCIRKPGIEVRIMSTDSEPHGAWKNDLAAVNRHRRR